MEMTEVGVSVCCMVVQYDVFGIHTMWHLLILFTS